MGTNNSPPVGNNGVTWTFATLPSVVPIGTVLSTSDKGLCTFGVGGWAVGTAPTTFVKNKRNANIAAFLSGAAIPAPAWAATTAYVVGDRRTLPTGQVLECTTAGTSAGTAPAYSKTILTGRPLVDGTVTWFGVYQTNGVTAVSPAPTATLFASAAAAGLTETNLISGTLSPLLTCYGGILTRNGFQNAAAAFTFAGGPATGAGNATGIATGAGYPATYVYNSYNYDIEFYITDSVVGLTFVGSTAMLGVEIDGVLMQANPPPGNGTAGQALVFDFNGVTKRRRVCVNCSTPVGSSALRGVALTPSGYVEVTDSPNDQMLLLGDSLLQTISSPAPLGPVTYLGALLKRYLGLSGVIGCGLGGSGYIAQLANTFNSLNILLNPVNQQVFAQMAPNHIMISQGYNDIGTAPALVAAAALTTWQQARLLFPNAKITVTDGFSQAKGPDATTLAQAAAILQQYDIWADPNSRFVQSTTATAATAWVQGTGTASGGLVAGNSGWVVGTDNVHSTPLGANYQAKRLADAISAAWNGEY